MIVGSDNLSALATSGRRRPPLSWCSPPATAADRAGADHKQRTARAATCRRGLFSGALSAKRLSLLRELVPSAEVIRPARRETSPMPACARRRRCGALARHQAEIAPPTASARSAIRRLPASPSSEIRALRRCQPPNTPGGDAIRSSRWRRNTHPRDLPVRRWSLPG